MQVLTEVTGSQRLFFMCLDFGGQNHITKAVIKMRQCFHTHDLYQAMILAQSCLNVFFPSQFAQKNLEMKPSILVNWPFKCKTSL